MEIKSLRDGWRIGALLLPGILMLSVFTLYPISKMVVMSFFDWRVGLNQASPFVGLQNYVNLFSDPIARMALVNTLYYAMVSVPGQMAFGLLTAVMIHNVTRFSVSFRLLYYLPVITSWVVVALLFRNIFTNQGLLNFFLMDVLKIVDEPIRWLSTRWPAMTAASILGIWKGVGWNMVIFLAALQAVPVEYYEASSIDGMGPIGQFFKITLPNIKGTILFCVVMLSVGAFNTFTPIMVITEGNPAHQTEVVLTWIYYQAFRTTGNMGYAAAYSLMLAIITAGIAVVLFKFIRPEEGK